MSRKFLKTMAAILKSLRSREPVCTVRIRFHHHCLPAKMEKIALIFSWGWKTFSGGAEAGKVPANLWLIKQPVLFGMAAMPFLCYGILLNQCNLPGVLPVLILKYVSCLIPYIDLFLFLCGEWSSLVFKDFPKVFFKPNVFCCCNCFEDCLLLLFIRLSSLNLSGN